MAKACFKEAKDRGSKSSKGKLVSLQDTLNKIYILRKWRRKIIVLEIIVTWVCI